MAELPKAPTITSFKADATRITSGQSVTLTFKVENATRVELVDSFGQTLDLTGSASEGTAVATPASTAFYVLRATGEGGKDVAYVQVAVDGDLEEVYLVAVPPRVSSGERVQLLWSAPGARSAVIQQDGQQLVLDHQAGSGVQEVTPTRTSSFILVANGVDGSEALSASTQVLVDPVLEKFEALPGAALPGEKITFAWKTRGASKVTVSEAAFGTIASFSTPGNTAEVDQGTALWTVPEALPSGEAVMQGHPLKFKIQVESLNPASSFTRELRGYVGNGPRIDVFSVPSAVGEGKPLTIRWVTTNAARLQLFVRGALAYEAPAYSSFVENGSVTLPALGADSELELKVSSHLGATTSLVRPVEVVGIPAVNTFSVDNIVTQSGDPSTATWTTTDADEVSIRIENGPEIFRTSDPAQVANGSTELRLGLSSRIVFEAWNRAGNVARANDRIVVTTPEPVSATPAPTSPGEQVSLAWTLSASTTSGVVGVPATTPLKNEGSTAFDVMNDPLSERLLFADANDSIAPLSIPTGFRFPFFGETKSRFWVSTNGFVAFEDVGALPENVDLTAPDNVLPTLIAPYWDDLDMSSGQVRYTIDGSSYPRRLIIEWNKARLVADRTKEVTFQVQLFETGEFRFLYPGVTTAAGEEATIGVQRQNGEWIAQHAFGTGTAMISEGDELVWFSSASAAGSFQYVADVSRVPTLFARVASGMVAYAAPVYVFGPTTLSVSEAMPVSPTNASAGTWVELTNNTNVSLDLGGLELATAGSTLPYLIPSGTIVEPGRAIVFGESADPSENGGVPNLEHTFTGMVWADPNAIPYPGDAVQVFAGTNVVASLSWTNVPAPGVSVQEPEKAIDGQGNPISCSRTRGYGTQGAIGTPGTSNESCFGYTLQPAPFSWFDISQSGTEYIRGKAWEEEIVDVSSAPIPFFGKDYSTFKLSQWGFVTFRSSVKITSSWNSTLPDSSSPNGTVAPFGDTLKYLEERPDSGVFVKRILPGEDPDNLGGHWIVQWNRLYYNSSPHDDISFQAKFFDDGVIEFHYGALINGKPTNDEAFGDYATCWIENPEGTAALPVVKPQEPLLTPFSAFRFTPN